MPTRVPADRPPQAVCGPRKQCSSGPRQNFGARYVHGRALVPLPAAADARVRLAFSCVAWPCTPSTGHQAVLPIDSESLGAFSYRGGLGPPPHNRRSEEHTSELQSHSDLVCRLLLEKKKKLEPITTT